MKILMFAIILLASMSSDAQFSAGENTLRSLVGGKEWLAQDKCPPPLKKTFAYAKRINSFMAGCVKATTSVDKRAKAIAEKMSAMGNFSLASRIMYQNKVVNNVIHHGHTVFWDPKTMEKTSEGNYLENKQEGKWKFYNHVGYPMEVQELKNGKTVKATKVFPHKSLITCPKESKLFSARVFLDKILLHILICNTGNANHGPYLIGDFSKDKPVVYMTAEINMNKLVGKLKFYYVDKKLVADPVEFEKSPVSIKMGETMTEIK